MIVVDANPLTDRHPSAHEKCSRACAPALRACLKDDLLVAQATRLFRPATRRTERERQFEPIGTVFSLLCPWLFRSAGRRPGRAGRPRHPFSKQALSI